MNQYISNLYSQIKVSDVSSITINIDFLHIVVLIL
jgi:hypothetical protein